MAINNLLRCRQPLGSDQLQLRVHFCLMCCAYTDYQQREATGRGGSVLLFVSTIDLFTLLVSILLMAILILDFWY